MLLDLLRHADQVRDLRKAASLVPGLPAVGTSRKPNLAATTTNLFAPQDSATPSGMPSVKMKRMPGGGVMVEIRRNTRFAALLDEGDLGGLERIAGQMKARAENQSQGTLTTRDLRRRGHPFGRNDSGAMRGKLGRGYAKGVRGAVPSLSIVNRQSGNFASSWDATVELNENGVVIRLMNDSSFAGFLSFGTRFMQAHSPATSVPAAFMSQVNGEWQRMIYRATRRKQLESDVAFSLGLL